MLGDSQSEMKLLTKMSPESADYQRRYLTAQPMPTVSEYLAAHSATAGTDYALDTGKKTLTIKTVSGAAWWSVNSASYLDYAVKLDTDLDLFDFLWSPVGADANAPFIGTFDGQNHRLFNLSIRAKGEYTGLFGCVNNAKIQNLCIASGKIFDVYRDVETYVGSVAGCAEGSTIVNCGNRAAISAFCLQTSTQNAFTGGLVGKMRGNTGVIANSYNTGVLGQSFGGWMQMGGIVGDDGGSKVLNCYSAGRQYNAVYLQSSTKHMGGITGRTASKNAENIQGCYYYRNQSNWTYDAMAGLELKPIAEMQAAVSSLNAYVAQNPGNGYATWLADSVNTPVNSGFPVLPTAGSSSGDPSAPPTLSAAEYLLQHPAVDGTDYALNTSAHTLVIKTAEGAAWWSANGNSADYKGFQSYTIVLENDLDLSGFLWTPVGSESKPVTAATFDGMGHRISNLTVDMQSSSAAYAGLFGKVVGATIRNLGLVNVNIAVTSTATSTAKLINEGVFTKAQFDAAFPQDPFAYYRKIDKQIAAAIAEKEVQGQLAFDKYSTECHLIIEMYQENGVTTIKPMVYNYETDFQEDNTLGTNGGGTGPWVIKLDANTLKCLECYSCNELANQGLSWEDILPGKSKHASYLSQGMDRVCRMETQLLLKKGVIGYRQPTYNEALARINTYLEITQTIETTPCTILIGETNTSHGGYADINLIYKSGSAVGEGKTLSLPMPSESCWNRTSQPDKLWLSDDALTLYYSYHYDEPLVSDEGTPMEHIEHQAGTYCYTSDLKTGKTSLNILVNKQ